MFAVVACGTMISAAPVHAVVAPIDSISIAGGLFVIDEYAGHYTVTNNSSSWYIYAFAVSNPNALVADPGPSTTYSNWAAYALSLSLNGPNPVPVNAYVTADADTTSFDNVHLIPASIDLSHYIGPNSSSDLFLFTGLAASDAGLLVVDVNGLESQFSSSADATPLPAALPLFVSGAGLLGFLGWRRKRKAAALAA